MKKWNAKDWATGWLLAGIVMGFPCPAQEGNSPAPPLVFELLGSDQTIRLDEVLRPGGNQDPQKKFVTLRVTNRSDRDLVLFPYVGLDVFAREGGEVERTRYLGRWGRRRYRGCTLRNIQFITIKAGKSHVFRSSLAHYELDFRRIIGWSLKRAGRYQLVFRYRYDRQEMLKFCQQGCKDHNDPQALWNRAIEINRKVVQELTVSP